MALFTNPVVLSDDGGSTTDRSFSFLSQDVSNPNSVTGVWIEDAANVSAESKMVIKHDQRTLKNGFRRDLLSRTVKLLPAAGAEEDGPQLVTINLTITASSLFTAAELQGEVNLLIDAAEESNFLLGMRQGKI